MNTGLRTELSILAVPPPRMAAQLAVQLRHRDPDATTLAGQRAVLTQPANGLIVGAASRLTRRRAGIRPSRLAMLIRPASGPLAPVADLNLIRLIQLNAPMAGIMMVTVKLTTRKIPAVTAARTMMRRRVTGQAAAASAIRLKPHARAPDARGMQTTTTERTAMTRRIAEELHLLRQRDSANKSGILWVSDRGSEVTLMRQESIS